MSLATYTDLQASIAGWMNRTDLTAFIPDFIRLAEERLQRALRVQEMEAVMTPVAIVAGSIAAPAGALAIKTAWITGYETAPLKPQSYEALLALGTNDTPTRYAWVGSTLYFDGAGTVNAIVYQAIPPLASNSTNWLLTGYPSAYLFAALVEGWLFLRNKDEAKTWDDRLQQTLDEIGGNDQRDSMNGPLVAKAR
jgi:hypothetical protein